MLRRALILSFALSTLLLAVVPSASAATVVCNGQDPLPLYEFANECADWTVCVERSVMSYVMCNVIGGPFCQFVPGPC